MQMVGEFLSDLRVLQGDISRIVGTGLETSQNVQTISEIGEDRLAGFLRRMEAAALNIEEMTARLRDDPSLIIRGSDKGRLKP
jgi:phospholipid/cholesterol/gamma-HCH transport system substrate-binding protein